MFLAWISLLLCLMPCFVFRSMFPHVHMFRSTCLGFYVMFFYVLVLFLLYVDVRITCSHAWYHVYGYVLLRSTRLVCMFYAPMPISESSHACMLGFMSFHVYVLNFYMFTCIFYAYMSMSMPPHASVFGSMLSTCFMLFSMFHVIFHVLVCSMPCSHA